MPAGDPDKKAPPGKGLPKKEPAGEPDKKAPPGKGLPKKESAGEPDKKAPPGKGRPQPSPAPSNKGPAAKPGDNAPMPESRGEDKLPEGDASPPVSPKERASQENLVKTLIPQACSSARTRRPSGKDAAPNKRSAAVPESAKDPLISPPPKRPWGRGRQGLRDPP
jgi:hypothetical protein